MTTTPRTTRPCALLTAFITTLCAPALFAFDGETNTYYGKNFNKFLASKNPLCQARYVGDVKTALTEILSSAHIQLPGKADKIVPSCEQALEEEKQNCKEHNVLGYKKARQLLFGKIHLQSTRTQDIPEDPSVGIEYFIKDIYCLKNYTNADMPVSAQIGPDLIPEHTVLNTEHVWPKSRFKNNSEKETGAMYEMKVSDLHILYPSDEDTNSLRSNYEFGNVSIVKKESGCSSARLGYLSEENQTKLYFEPPKESKGNVARSVFYFSVRYNVNIDDVEEAFLKAWHEEDPIDFMEYYRNSMIYANQNVRNPFIDFPHLVKKIVNF